MEDSLFIIKQRINIYVLNKISHISGKSINDVMFYVEDKDDLHNAIEDYAGRGLIEESELLESLIIKYSLSI